MKTFRLADHAQIYFDRKIKNENGDHPVIVSSLNSNSMGLIAQYYAEKYQTQIEFPNVWITNQAIAKSAKEYINLRKANCDNFEASLVCSKGFHSQFINIKENDRETSICLNGRVNSTLIETAKRIWEVKTTSGDSYRQAFILGADWSHATPIIYLKEKGKECILYADSLGVGDLSVIKNLVVLTGIKVYALENPRQADSKSCYTDALIFARDTTAIDLETGQYFIPDLISHLENRSENHAGINYAKLPNKLLKTTQISTFLEEHENSNEINNQVHKKETLGDFRKRYRDENVCVLKQNKIRDIPNYLRLKGIKLVDIMEIQFYINEMRKELAQNGNLLTEDKKKKFIAEAKLLLRTEPITSNNQRKGLDEFANSFLNEIEKDLVKVNNPKSGLSPQSPKETSQSPISIEVLGYFMYLLGIAVAALSLIFLSGATLGIGAAIGGACALTGLGLFAIGSLNKSKSELSEISGSTYNI